MADPVFVVGCPRSGTSVMSWAIAQHPRFTTSNESHFLYYLVRRGPRGEHESRVHEAYATSLTGDSWLDRHAVSLDEFAAAVGKGLHELFTSRAGGKIWVDSSPEHVLVMPALALMFPRAKFVHMVRDARAVCRSMLNSGFPAPWATDLKAASDTWNHYVKAGLAAEDVLDQRVLRIRQEDLRDQPEDVTRQVFRFLGTERPEGVVAFLEDNTINSSYNRRTQLGGGRPSTPPTQTGQGPLPMLKRPPWSPEMIRSVEAECRPLLTRLGYACS